MQNEKNFLSRPLKDVARENHASISSGVSFIVKYRGCVEVFASMKVLNFTTRSLVAKECIHRLCDAITRRTPKTRNVDKEILQCINAQPCMELAGSSVSLQISSRCLEIKSLETNETIARHDMPRVSFASGGDAETLDFVAYVAKDVTEWRACYVIECGSDKAQTIISTMGQAFEMRYKEYYENETEKFQCFPEALSRKESKKSCDKEYYNDQPGKLPPEPPSIEMKNQSPRIDKPRERVSSNLIDLGCSLDNVNGLVGDLDEAVFADTLPMPTTSPGAKLISEKWFHGLIPRTSAEALLKNDGDFLVRESQNTRGQFVLTGMKAGQPKHLLLVDPDGCVRTKDRIFDNIPHLINHHWTNFMPIISSESALLLQTPIFRGVEFRK